MDIKSLLDLTCAKVASMIKGECTSSSALCAQVAHPPRTLLPCRQDAGGDQEDVQHRQRLHSRGGGTGPRGEQVVRRGISGIEEGERVGQIKDEGVDQAARGKAHSVLFSELEGVQSRREHGH